MPPILNIIPLFQFLSEDVKAQISSISSVQPNAAGVCAMENCLETEGQFCKLTAICTKLTGAQKLFPVDVMSTSRLQPIRTRYFGHVTGYQPIRNHGN
eukprot:sb/3478891/